MDTDDEEADAEQWPVEPKGRALTTAAQDRDARERIAHDRPALEHLWAEIQRLMTARTV